MKTIDREKFYGRLESGGSGELSRAALDRISAQAGTPARTLEVIGAEIREHTVALEYHARATIWEAVEIGRRLDEARSIAKHGEWTPFLESIGINDQKAQRLMRVYREYGEKQKSLFGTGLSNPSALTGLSYTKALMLLAIEDEGEREEFIEVHDVENMSTRELKEAIRERDEAVKAAAESESAAVKAEERANHAEQQVKTLIADLEEAENQAEAALKQLNDTKHELTGFKAADTNLRRRLEQTTAEAERLAAQVKELESRPVDVAVMSVDQEAIEKAKAEAVAEIQAKLDKAKEKAAKAEEKRKAAEDALAAANEKLEAAKRAEAQDNRSSSPSGGGRSEIIWDKELANFEMLFSQTQEKVNVMHGVLLKVRGRGDSELVGKLQKALLALSDAVRRCAE